MIKSDARKVLTELRASLFFIIFFKRKELTTNAPSFAVRRQFLLLSRKRRGLEVARRIFLVQSQRNQWLSRFACTKGAADFRRLGAFSWCKANAINGFPGLLAPKAPLSGGAAPVSGGGAPAGTRATSSAAFPSPWCASGIPVSAFRLLPCASVLRFLASSPRNRRSPGVLS